ncbi:MAG TPA: hypothetical protein VLT61_03910 [Anaeromyxobacteraceae bacterium]|nr:hypothetical protein [Anaeromyxobacteraceae bacterium]
MLRTSLAFALTLTLALAAAPSLASAEDELPGSTTAPEKHKKQQDLQLRALGGTFDGMGVRRSSGGLAVFEADWKPTLRSESVEVAFPLRFDHRQTFGASLNETTAGAGVDVDFVDGGLRHGPVAGASYTWRPNWPDLYQPDGVGGMASTDRYTHSRWFLGWQLWNKLGDGKHLRLKAEYVKYDYVRDPNYDPSASVVHLAPRDNGEAKIGASFRQLSGAFAYALRIDAFYRRYDVLLAKKADTGATSRSDPLASLYGVEPRAEAEYRTKPVTVTLGYGFISQTDPFQGYYSNTGHHPYVEAKLEPMQRLSLSAKLSARLLTYGPNSKSISSDGGGAYVQGTEDGKRLQDNRVELKAGAHYKLHKGLYAVAEAEWLRRETNYRDYVPGVFPPTATRPYDIKWDYTNTMVTAGVEWRP